MCSVRTCRRWLGKNFPVKGRVIVRAMKPSELSRHGAFSRAWFYRKCWVIAISSTATTETQIDQLIHEWSHVLTWDSRYSDQHHTPAWQRKIGEIAAAWESHKGNP